MNVIQSIIIAIVEGITEFLPISSTAHMAFTANLLGITDKEYVELFIENIQFGAILSVVVLYWKRFLGKIDFDFYQAWFALGICLYKICCRGGYVALHVLGLGK